MTEPQPVDLAPVDEPGDAELISAVRAGDVDAYGLLFTRHVEAARRLARQLVSAGDVDDLVSEAFAKVLSVLQRGGGPDLAFRAYLLTSVRRLHVDKLRGSARVRTTDDLTPYDPGVPFQDTAVAGFENATAAKAFASLPERWQQVLWHTEVEGQKPAEIAPMLGMSPNSVSALAYRAREGLRQAFVTMHAQPVVEDACAVTRANLGGYLRGGLSRRDSAKVESHLADCRPCSAIYLELGEINADLGAVLAPVLLGSAGAGYLAAAHLGAAAAAKGGIVLLLGRVRDWILHNPAGRATGGAAAATVLAVAAVGGMRLSGSPERPVAARTTPATSPAADPAPAAPAAEPPASAPEPPSAVPAVEAPTTPARPTPSTTPAPTPPKKPAKPEKDATKAADSAPVIATPLADVTVAPGATSTTIDLTRGARDADGDALSVKSARISSRPPHGNVVVGGAATRTAMRAVLSRAPHGSGTVTYTPQPSWRGTETIAYVLTDGHGGTVGGTVEVTTPNRLPVAVADTPRVHVAQVTRSWVPIDVLANDTDANGDTLVLAAGLVDGPDHGEAVVEDGTVRYRPELGYRGTDSLRYAISDGHGGTAIGTVTITVGLLPNRLPPLREGSFAIGDDEIWSYQVPADPDGDELTVTASGDGLEVDGRTITYTPLFGRDSERTFTYTVSDGAASRTATVTVTATAPHGDLSLSANHDPTHGYLGSHFEVTGIPEGRHVTATVTVEGIDTAQGQDGWSSNDIALDDACGGWSADGTTRTLVCHLDAGDNGRELGHFDAYAASITLLAEADDFHAEDASLTVR